MGMVRSVRTSSTAPPPTVQLGHYVGTTSQNEKFFFDVTTNGSRNEVVNLGTGQLNQSCDPPDYYLYAATVADLYARLGRTDEAVAALATAIEQAPTGAERRLLRERREALVSESGS